MGYFHSFETRGPKGSPGTGGTGRSVGLSVREGPLGEWYVREERDDRPSSTPAQPARSEPHGTHHASRFRHAWDRPSALRSISGGALLERTTPGHPAGFPLQGVSPPPTISLRYFICSEADHREIEQLLQMSIPPAALRQAVESAVRNAVSWARAAADTLRRGSRSAATRQLFREAFGTLPEHVPAWRPAGQTWDHGDVVRTRLLRAAHILAGGWIRFYCWGRPSHCHECRRQPPTYWACSSWGQRYVICLGQAFWRAWRDNDTASLATTMLHEALHIYFGRLVRNGDSGRIRDATCYERFVLRANGIPLPAGFDQYCAAAV